MFFAALGDWGAGSDRGNILAVRSVGRLAVLLISCISCYGIFCCYHGGALSLQTFILNHVFGEIEPDVRAYSETYLLITAASIPFIAIYNSGAAVFRANGKRQDLLGHVVDCECGQYCR